ncbi:MAG: serine/threonine protein kinase [Polyangiaceae bacterium]
MTDSQQRYRVIERLESGGMAEVFRAESEGLQGFRKQVAIKRVLPNLSSKKKFISMFLDEARLSAQLSHSNCVQVFDIGVGDNAYFIVMEFVDGGNLKSIIEHIKKKGGDFPLECAVYICVEICKGLAYAHELTDSSGTPLHIVHRDMSPPNVLITKHGEIKIVDFGLAKANSQIEKSEPGIIKGKFSYLAPEAAMGQDVDARTDIFAIGIMLWELLAGQRLFLGDTDFQTVKKVQAAVVPPISGINKKVPKDLETILTRSLAREPAARYQTAREFGIDLTRFLFKFGVPVSTFDVGKLVQGAMKERQAKKPVQASIIDKLIEEALFEFTSLGDEKGGGGAKPATPSGRQQAAGAAPGAAGFVDVGNWIDEIAAPRAGESASSLSGAYSGVTAGNLAALEDDDEPAREPGRPSASTTDSEPPPSQSPSNPPPSSGRKAPSAAAGPSLGPTAAAVEKRSSAGAKVGVMVAVAAVAVAGAAAWFTHLIPHP